MTRSDKSQTSDLKPKHSFPKGRLVTCREVVMNDVKKLNHYIQKYFIYYWDFTAVFIVQKYFKFVNSDHSFF